MSVSQRAAIFDITAKYEELRHGDCVGADADMHLIARERGQQVVIHPPLDPKLRAFCYGDFVYPPRDYLQRDRDIVDASSILFATPAEYVERQRSGTWYSIRYAKSVGKPVVIVWPDGTYKKE